MTYRTRRYKEGLSGQKPGWIWLDEEGHRAQEAGYRDHLRNQDLAEQLRGGVDTYDGGGSSSYSSEPEPPKPLTLGQLFFWACALLGGATLMLASLVDSEIESLSRGNHPTPWAAYIVPGVINILLFCGGIGIVWKFWSAVLAQKPTNKQELRSLSASCCLALSILGFVFSVVVGHLSTHGWTGIALNLSVLSLGPMAAIWGILVLRALRKDGQREGRSPAGWAIGLGAYISIFFVSMVLRILFKSLQ